jgi:hypothetical protein
MSSNLTANASLRRWRAGHWAFFVQLQGMIAALNRLQLALDAEDWPTAGDLLAVLARLLSGSAAAMRFAADLSPAAYETTVRPTMEMPQTEGFSGMLSREHRHLMQAIRALRPRFEALQERLPERYREFQQAHAAVVDAHVHVCKQFGGDSAPSLRMGSSGRSAVEVLENVCRIRTKMLEPGPAEAVR